MTDPKQQRRLFALNNDIGLTDEERYELSERLFDKRSWGNLTDLEASRLADSLNGFSVIYELLRLRVRR